MFRHFFSVLVLFLMVVPGVSAQQLAMMRDLRPVWMTHEEDVYRVLGDERVTGLNTIYFSLDEARDSGHILRLASHKPYYLFVNGKIYGAYQGEKGLPVDSLLQRGYGRSPLIALHQDGINERDLRTEVVSKQSPDTASVIDTPVRPYWYFRDFVVTAGLVIIILFLIAIRLNPKLAGDYFSISKLISSRESDDSQASARLTSGSNVQFYVLCSLLIGFYLIIVLHNLPEEYALPVHFHASAFGMLWWQWIKLSAIIFFVLLLKMLIIFLLTRLFNMQGMARFHFFNWTRLLLLVFGGATILLFMYFIGRGSTPEFFTGFLSVIVLALVAWIVMAFFKLGGRSGHSMFHLFSYLCTTEIIPLLITVKVLFH